MMGDRRKPIPAEIQRRITKFYVSNLPNRCSGNDLAGVLREYGIIYDIYIAKKRDKGGNRFGFVSFLDVKNKGDMVRRMANTRLGEYKLSINVARFVLEDGEINDRDTENERAVKNPRMQTYGGQSVRFVRKSSISFRDVLTGERSKEMTGSKTLVVEDKEVAYEDLLGRTLVVRVGSFEVLRNINSTLTEMGLASGVLRYLGGMNILLSFITNEHAIMAMDEIKGREGDFESVSIWKGQDITFERLAWVKVQGLPMYVLSNEVINNVAKLFGTVVHEAKHEYDDADVSHCYVGVAVNDGRRVQGEVSVFWKDKLFTVWVTEDSGDWLLDFSNNNDRKTVQLHGEEKNLAEQSMETHNNNEEEGTNVQDNGGSDVLEKGGSGMGHENMHSGSNSLNRVAPNADKENGGDKNISVDQSKNTFFFNSLAKKQKRFRRPKDGTRHKKIAHNSDPSPSFGNRPKKRSRLEEDDPFDIDRLIGISKSAETQVREDSRFTEGSSIDLNAQACSDMDNMVPLSSSPSKPAMEGGSCSSPAGDLEVDKEVGATMGMGTLLGFDLSNHVGRVRESILDEGF